MRRLVPLVLLAMLAACGGTHSAAHHRVRHGLTPTSPTEPVQVVVVAPVLERPGMAPMACHAILTSLPPAGCSGVRVTGYDFRAVPGVQRFADGTWQTPALRIAGAWDGRELHVRRVASAHARAAAAPIPMRCRVRPAGRALALARRIGRDPSKPLAAGPCGRTAWVLMPLADRATVRAIHARYGRRVVVLGWLAPRRADR